MFVSSDLRSSRSTLPQTSEGFLFWGDPGGQQRVDCDAWDDFEFPTEIGH